MNFVRLYIVELVLVCYSGVLSAQQIVHPVNPVISRARFSNNFSNTLDVSLNPSLGAFISGVEVGLHVEKKYLLKELGMFIISACIPVHGDGLSVSAKVFGTNNYQEKTVSLGYGKALGIVNAGISIAYVDLHVARRKRASLVQTTVSSIIRVNEEMFFGLSLINPRFLVSQQKELRLASTYSFGIGWQASPVTYTGIETIKEENTRVAIVLLLQYLLAPHFIFSLSWSVTANQPCVSFSWRQKKLRLGTGAAYHPSLGPSPFASLVLHKQAGENVNE